MAARGRVALAHQLRHQSLQRLRLQQQAAQMTTLRRSLPSVCDGRAAARADPAAARRPRQRSALHCCETRCCSASSGTTGCSGRASDAFWRWLLLLATGGFDLQLIHALRPAVPAPRATDPEALKRASEQEAGEGRGGEGGGEVRRREAGAEVAKVAARVEAAARAVAEVVRAAAARAEAAGGARAVVARAVTASAYRRHAGRPPRARDTNGRREHIRCHGGRSGRRCHGRRSGLGIRLGLLLLNYPQARTANLSHVPASTGVPDHVVL